VIIHCNCLIERAIYCKDWLSVFVLNTKNIYVELRLHDEIDVRIHLLELKLKVSRDLSCGHAGLSKACGKDASPTCQKFDYPRWIVLGGVKAGCGIVGRFPGGHYRFLFVPNEKKKVANEVKETHMSRFSRGVSGVGRNGNGIELGVGRMKVGDKRF